MNDKAIVITHDLVRKLIATQFPKYKALLITEVEQQGHDNRTYRLGSDMLIRIPTTAQYALQVPKEQELLPQLAKSLSVSIPAPINMGKPSADYPYPFSIYNWLPGKSINLLTLADQEKERLALDLAKFLQDLHAITNVRGLRPGQHNWWRGDHIGIYDNGFREQIAKLTDVIDVTIALDLWDKACATKWEKTNIWIHGDFAIGNLLMDKGKLSAVIDFSCTAIGDPACDLVIGWTYLSGKARDIFFTNINMDSNTCLRARAWALWKATFELCQIKDKNISEAETQKIIIKEVTDV
jgi:aminoglycoside phosphotransferase (APT) family kinase protein